MTTKGTTASASRGNINEECKGRILVVDDMPANLRMLIDMLSTHGYVVHPSTDAETALHFLESTVPDLVLLDVIMPSMSGYELCSLMKASPRTRDIPVIFLSSADQELDKVKAFDCGAVDYIVRPLQAAEVLARIQTHLSLSKLQRNLEELVTERTAELVTINERLQNENNERRQAEERIRYMAHYDALTALPNRSLLQDRITQAVAHARRNANRVAVMFIDLDYFKHINDSLGHHVGDLLLKQVAQRLTHCLREDDSVARLGGDEFVLCLSSINGGDPGHIAQKVLNVLDQSFIIEGHDLHIGASIGISIFPDDGVDAEMLMRAADTAMYSAKEKGRGNFQFFTPALNEAAQERLDINGRLRQALAREEFSVYYQPQVDMETGTIFSAEALLRCPAPGGKGVISCGAFISIAEETGLILPLGEWVLRQACRQLKQWHNEGHPMMRVAVNLSSRQFYQPNFLRIVEEILEQHELPAHALDLEITESLLLQRNDSNIAILRHLSNMGVQLSIDDFGTGYSSLAYLQRFPVHALKIDRSFVNGITSNPSNTALVSAVIGLAHSLDLKVLAEGVETAQQATFLQLHGCRAAQGFLYSQAVPANVMTEMLCKRFEPTM